MTTYCSLLHAEYSPMQKHLVYYADQGMGYLLSVAGGGSNWTVKDSVRESAAALLLQRLISTTYTMPKLDETEQIAANNLVAKVLLHMKYKQHRKRV